MQIQKDKGFTLVEVMVTVAIVAILAALAAPSLKQFLDNNKIRAEAQRIGGLFSFARNYAVTNNQPVVVYVTLSDGVLNIDIYDDDDPGSAVATEPADDIYLQRSQGVATGLNYVIGDNVTDDNAVRFDEKGRIDTTTATVSISDADNQVGQQFALNAIGRTSFTTLYGH